MAPRNCLCILCYKLVSTPSIKSEPFLLLLSKYLKFVSCIEERKGEVPPEELLLCSDCSKVARSFSKLYLQLEEIELDLRREVKSIYERTVTSQYIPSRSAQFQKQFDSSPPPQKGGQQQHAHGHEDPNVLVFKNIGKNIQQLRNELIQHCKVKLDSTPESLLQNPVLAQLKNEVDDLDKRDKISLSQRTKPLQVQGPKGKPQVKEDDSDEEDEEEEAEGNQSDSDSEESGSSSSSSGSSSSCEENEIENDNEWDDGDFGGGDEGEGESEQEDDEPEEINVKKKKIKEKKGEGVPMPTNRWDWLHPDFLPATQCEVCHDTFDSITAVEKHRAVFHNLSNFVRCQGCGSTYTTFHTLLKHRRKAKKGSKCYLKDIKSFQPESKSEFPLYSGLSATKFCPQEGCHEIFAFDEHITIHLKTHGNWSCGHCQEVFQKAHQLAWHELTLHNENTPEAENQYNCSRCKCQKSFQKGMLYHFMSEHLGISAAVDNSTADVKCHICHRGFHAATSKKEMDMHIKTEHNIEGLDPNKVFKCTICDAPFRRQKSLTLHIKGIHKTTPDFPCSECGKTFREARNVRKHFRRMHKGSNSRFLGDYECDICHDKFRHPTLLELHKKAHGNDGGIFTCEQCGSTFTKKATMRRHMLNKHRPPSYCCDHCGKLFATQGRLNEHIRTHDKNFSPAQRQRRNLARETEAQDNNAFICDFCGNTFKQAATLRMHIRKVHEREAAVAVDGQNDMKYVPMLNYY
ncbi:unnamed protein product [Orchesella dallaii]|uniref:C2H2-type domain-containing protein n=1 Tax=Orchesella dallaii TaxID=48710 RepID=A0ABP1SAJ7_9HEXA